VSSTALPAPRDAVIPNLTTSSQARAARIGESHLVLLTVLAAVAYVGWHLGRGWLAVDDGTLGHTAERVLLGELPHRDFDDVYTGGLAFVNAAAFRLVGTTLWTLRLVLLAFFVAWVPTVYYLARRFCRPLAASGVTLVAVVWSVPSYPAAMPSWYNLFFATFGVAACFRYLEAQNKRWLVAAGIAGGLSFLVKVVGLYYVAGMLLFLVYQAHAESKERTGPGVRCGTWYALFVTAALTAFVAALVMLVRRQLHASELVQFVLPGAMIAALLVRIEWASPAGSSRTRFVGLAQLLAPFLLGVALPIALFLLPYARSGSVGAFINGVFLLPTKRFGIAEMRMLPLWTTVGLLPIVGLVLAGQMTRGRSTAWWLAVLVPVLAALFVASLSSDAGYRFVWYSARNLLPLVVAVGVGVIARARQDGADAALYRARLLLLLAVSAVCTLIQFPYSAANYFCYVAPLVALAGVGLLPSLPRLTPAVPAALAAFYAAFAIARINGSPLYLMGERYLAPIPSQPLALPRGGIDVPNHMAPGYRALVTLLQRHARGGYTWASPDAPEIYFLSGLRNPTRSIFDFFDDPRQRTERVLGALDRHGVTAVALNRQPVFSAPFPPDLIAGLEQRYPYSTDVGPFHVRWRR
jgi:4-amino-4-deoxy-L-arabinose transferase-like glycosyltransferase